MNSEKERVDTRVDSTLLKKFRVAVVEIYGGLYGHMGKSIEEAMTLWLKKNNKT